MAVVTESTPRAKPRAATVLSPLPIAGRRVPELDGIRGLAIVSVLLYHFCGTAVFRETTGPFYCLLAPSRAGWSGVDCFFVLSGFLIGGILLDARDSPRYFQAFYARRMARILPLYYLLLAGFAVACSLRSLGVGGLEGLLKDLPPLWTEPIFAQNIWMAVNGSFAANGLTPTWSLAIEEQFYLTLPLIVRLAPRRVLAAFAVGVIVCAPVIRYWFIHYSGWPEPTYACSLLLPCRMDALGLGVLGAVLCRHQGCWAWLTGHRRTLYALLALAAAGFAAAILKGEDFSGRLTLIALFYFLLLLTAVTQPLGFVGGLMRWGWLQWFGGLCYGLYLLHTPVLYLCHMTRGPVLDYPRPTTAAGWATNVVALALTVALAKMSWEWLEKPCIRLGLRWNY